MVVRAKILPSLLRLCAVLIAWSACVAQAVGPMQTARLPSWVELLRSSGYVFSGRVVSVHLDGKAGESTLATVSLKFRVEEPVHGVVKGQTLAVKEWAGLWASERYHVGQKVFLFLYPPSKLGLTSPVWGGMGRFAVSDGGVLQIPRTTPGGDGVTPRAPD